MKNLQPGMKCRVVGHTPPQIGFPFNGMIVTLERIVRCAMDGVECWLVIENTILRDSLSDRIGPPRRVAFIPDHLEPLQEDSDWARKWFDKNIKVPSSIGQGS